MGRAARAFAKSRARPLTRNLFSRARANFNHSLTLGA